jgi:uncharacterized protein YlzI (FlbEa/FlbD family)
MIFNFLNSQEVSTNNIKKVAIRKGYRDGKAEKPTDSWTAGSVPFITQAHAIYSAEAERKISSTRNLLNNRIFETLEAREQINLLETQKVAIQEEISDAAERVKHFKSEIDGYKIENPMGRFARTRLIPGNIYWFVLSILIVGEILVTAPALIELFGEGSWQSWVIAVSVGFLPVAGAHLVGTFLKSRLDRQNPQEPWIKKIFISISTVLVFAIIALAVLRAGITEGELQNFTIISEDQTPGFLIIFFAALQFGFFSVAVGLGFLHHSPSADSLKDAKKELRKLKKAEKLISEPLNSYKSKLGLTEDEVAAKVKALSNEIEILSKELDIAVANYREANIHARRDDFNGGHPSLTVPPFEIEIGKFDDIFSSLPAKASSAPGNPSTEAY